MFRTLNANEIDVRVAQINEKGATLLLYKDARCDQNILDDTVGPMNWQRHHSRENANCIVSIWDDKKKQWIEKEDTGKESFTEKEKGLASDSFKRACFNWGIGRELYTAPYIWITSSKVNLKDTGRKDKYNKPIYTTYDKFTVKEIAYNDNREISKLVIVNQDNKVIFNHEEKHISKTDSNNTDSNINEVISKQTINKIKFLADCYAKELGDKTTEQIMAEVKKRFNFKRIEDLTDSQGMIVVNKINEWIELLKKKRKTA